MPRLKARVKVVFFYYVPPSGASPSFRAKYIIYKSRGKGTRKPIVMHFKDFYSLQQKTQLSTQMGGHARAYEHGYKRYPDDCIDLFYI